MEDGRAEERPPDSAQVGEGALDADTTAADTPDPAWLAPLRGEYRAAAALAGVDLDEAPLDALAAFAALVEEVGGLDTRKERAAALGAVMAGDLAPLAAAFYDPKLRPEVERQLALLAGVDGLTGRATSLRRAVSAKAKAHGAREAAALMVPTDLDGDAPCGLDGFRMPPGYQIRGGALVQVQPKSDFDLFYPVAPRPLFIVGAAVNPATGQHFVELAWQATTGRDERRTVPRKEVFGLRDLTALAAFGAPVNQLNAGAVMAYLSAFEELNSDLLTPRLLVDRMGWADLDGDGRAFVVGEEVFGPGADRLELRPMDGAGDVVAGWKVAGTDAGWRAAVCPVLAAYPVPGVLYLAALASPLLAILGCDPFVVDLAGETSHGKTTAAKLAASTWGDPREGRGVMHSWDGTTVGVERLASTVGNLALFLDETKRAGGPRKADPGEVLYALASGHGKRRGTTWGMGELNRWSLVAISTGEAPVTSSAEHGGTRARVLSITDPPFGPRSPEGAATTRGLVDALEVHHGHGGRALARWLVQTTPEDCAALAARFRVLRDGWAQRVEGGAGARLAAFACAVLMAGEVAQAAGLPCPDLAACEAVLEAAIRRGAAEADRPRAALIDLLSWLQSNPARVVDLEAPPERPPGWGWIGKRERDGGWAVVGGEARKHLEGLAYDYQGVIRAWADRGWLLSVGEGARTKPVELTRGNRPRCYVFPAGICAHVMDADEDGGGGAP